MKPNMYLICRSRQEATDLLTTVLYDFDYPQIIREGDVLDSIFIPNLLNSGLRIEVRESKASCSRGSVQLSIECRDAQVLRRVMLAWQRHRNNQVQQ